MTQWRAMGRGQTITPQSGTRYMSVDGTESNSSAEDITTIKFFTAYTVSLCRAKTSANNGTTSFAFRDDSSSSSNLTLSITTTGWTEDATGSDTPAANSLCNFIVTAGGSHSNTNTIDGTLLTYEHASTNQTILAAQNGSFSPAANNFWALRGARTTTEAESKVRILRAVGIANLRHYQSTAFASGWTLSVGKNGASSSNVTIASASTGWIEDATGSESFASGDDFNFRGIYTTNSWSVGPITATADVSTQLQTGAGTSAFSATTREYEWFKGGIPQGTTTADDNATGRVGTQTAANLQTYCKTAGSGTRDVTLRFGSANSTNVTCSITATGLAQDLTGSESISDTTHIGWSIASTSGAVGVAWTSIEFPWFAAGTTETISPSGTLTTAGSLSLVVKTNPAGTMASAGALAKVAKQSTPAGTMASAGANTYKVSVSESGTLTTAGSLANVKVATLAVDGTLTTAGAVTYSVAKALAGTLTSAGSLAWRLAHNVAGTLTSSGANTYKASVSESGTMASSGTLANVKTALLAVAGTLTTSGALAAKVAKALAGTLASAGSLSHKASTSQAGTLTTAGSLTNLQVAQLAASGTLPTAGTLSFVAQHNLAGTLSPTGALTNMVSLAMAGDLTTAGDLALVPIYGAPEVEAPSIGGGGGGGGLRPARGREYVYEVELTVPVAVTIDVMPTQVAPPPIRQAPPIPESPVLDLTLREALRPVVIPPPAAPAPPPPAVYTAGMSMAIVIEIESVERVVDEAVVGPLREYGDKLLEMWLTQ